MAKGNLFLGMGRGSIGDVTFYRSSNQQLSRVRNRKPRNPRTNRQLYQRAIMATVMRAYQAGKAIFDHSFQGKAVGSECQRVFMSKNLDLLRSTLALDLEREHDNQEARFVAPKLAIPVANSYIISSGNYPQNLFTFDAQNAGFVMPAAQQLPDVPDYENTNAYALRVGLVPGDIYTFAMFIEKEQEVYVVPGYTREDYLGTILGCDFGWVRLTVRSDVLVNDIPVQMNSLFDIDSGGFDFSRRDHFANSVPGGLIEIATFAIKGYMNSGSIGVIRSRTDQDLRSESSMIAVGLNDFGLVADVILDAWREDTASVGTSDLILEGGDI